MQESSHIPYVIAAYAVAVVVLGVLFIRSYCKYKNVVRRLGSKAAKGKK